uniref:Small ribosomal subunit Rsm22 n=1 Tax=Thermodesulfovibrio aggregans TaxID=86166 RepID=A0A7C4EQ92_9BACT
MHDFDFFLKIAFKNKIPSKQQLKNLILKTSNFFTFLENRRPVDYMKDPDFLRGYLIYFVPVNLSKLYSIFKEFFSHPTVFHKKDIKIVDIGCGPSPAIVSFFKLWQNNIVTSKYIRYTGIEQEENAIKIGEEIVKKLKPETLSIKYDFLRADISNRKTYIGLKELKPDIMIFSNSLGEIFDRSAMTQQDFINFIKPFAYKNEEFTLVIVEPATKKGASRLHRLRDALITELGLYPYSPCLNSLPCSALKEDNWCYEERRWNPPWYLSFLSSVGLQINYLKFSYIVLRKDGINIKDIFHSKDIVVKSTSHLLNEKGKSRLWACWNGNLMDMEKLKRDTKKDDPWLKIEKGSYFSIDKYITLSERKVRIPANASVKILYKFFIIILWITCLF